MTPEENLKALKEKHGEKLNVLFNRAARIPGLPRSLDYRMEQLLAIYDEATGLIGEFACCKKGCSYCCYQSVVISTWEAKRIADFTGKKMNQVIGVDLFEARGKQQKYIKQYSNKPCLFLKDQQCSIYEVRPVACRLHLSLAEDSWPCDIQNNSGAEVPYFNFTNAHAIFAMLLMSENCQWGDIREFFTSP